MNLQGESIDPAGHRTMGIQKAHILIIEQWTADLFGSNIPEDLFGFDAFLPGFKGLMLNLVDIPVRSVCTFQNRFLLVLVKQIVKLAIE
jgi:hypothetical protein